MKYINRPIENCDALEETIVAVNPHSKKVSTDTVKTMLTGYFNNPSRANQDKIEESEFYDDILPFIQKLIINAPNIIKKDHSALLLAAPGVLTIHKQECASILAMAFFGLFKDNTCRMVQRENIHSTQFGSLSFLFMWEERSIYILEFMLNYFMCVYDHRPVDTVTFARVDSRPYEWKKDNSQMAAIQLTKYPIESTDTSYQVSFCSKLIGGDRIYEHNNIPSSEELFLLCAPECYVARLYCAALNDNEALIVMGANYFSAYTGIMANTKFAGNVYDEQARMLNIICIDASTQMQNTEQYTNNFVRDLNKALCGFNITTGNVIATGNWCCPGGSNMYVKFIQQLLAASVTRNDLLYSISDDKYFYNDVMSFMEYLYDHDIRVSTLYEAYVKTINSCIKKKANLIKFDIFGDIIGQLEQT